MSRRQPRARYYICIGISLLGVISSMIPMILDAEESLGLQLLYILRGPEKANVDVAVVAINSESAKALGLPFVPNKWPRQLHANLVEKLSTRQAGVIAFDMIFYEPQDEVNDEMFASAIRNAGNVVLTQSIDRRTLPIQDQGGSRTVSLNIERMISAIPLLGDAAVGQAPFPLPKIPIQLNQYWLFRPGSGNIPTLPVVTFHIFAKEAFPAFIDLLLSVNGEIGRVIPVAEDGLYDERTIVTMIRPLRTLFENNSTLAEEALETLSSVPEEEITYVNRQLIRSLLNLYKNGKSRYINFYGPAGTIPNLPYHQLLVEPESDNIGEKSMISGRKAYFVGQTGSNWIKTHDGFYTVFSGKTGQDVSGVEIAATAFANLVEDKAVYPLPPVPCTLFLMIWGVITVLISLHFSSIVSAFGLVLLNGFYFVVANYQFKVSGVWYPLVVPILLQTHASYIVCIVLKYRQVSRERENIREAFGYYLPNDLVDRLSANTKALRLGGQVFYGVCLFTDAQNYTALSERLDPGSLTRLMNRYYEAVFGPIKDNKGLVLQVVGDSVMALWSAPEAKDELKNAACRAAIEITTTVRRFNKQVGQNAMPTRIGIHAGEMLLGNIGAMNHFEYRPVGDIVNTASRLEGLNKYLGTQVLVSKDAICANDGLISRPVGRFVFKGKSQPVHVHELILPDPDRWEEQDALCRLFSSGLDAFQHGRWDEAEQCFDQALQIDEMDGPSLFYIHRCRDVRHHPPGGDWDGVVCLEKK